MKFTKKIISILSITLVLLMTFQNVSLAVGIIPDQSNELNFEIIKGEKENQIIVIDNGVKSIIETEVVDNVFITRLYDENYNLLEYFTNDSGKMFSGQTNTTFYYEPFAGGDGTKENPYKLCNPKNDGSQVTDLSYYVITLMVGSVVTLASIAAALVSMMGYGPDVFTTPAAKQLIAGIYSILHQGLSDTWLSNHGVKMTILVRCVLLNHIDNAWNENIWFYGDSAKLTKFVTY